MMGGGLVLKPRQNRGPTEIMFAVAKAILDGKNGFTHVMMSAYLSWEQARNYLQVMVDGGLLEKSDSKKYALTKTGYTWYRAQSEAFSLAPGGGNQ